jgi:hypothetical protein
MATNPVIGLQGGLIAAGATEGQVPTWEDAESKYTPQDLPTPTAGADNALNVTDVKVVNYQAVAGDLIPISTLGAVRTITLPLTPAVGETVGWVDYDNNFDVNNVILGRNGENIEGLAEDLNINIANENIAVTYVDVTKGWKLLT